jgi:putative transposase
MARPLRVVMPGGLYHVMARGNERRSVFRDDADRLRYLDRLAHYRAKFSFRLLAYCLMDNHVHLALETGKAPLSQIMAGLQSSYTQYFNRRHHRVGHLFQGRYKALLVDKDLYALGLLRYIHENPVKAGLVKLAGQYEWSSDRYYRRGEGPDWLDVDRLLAMLATRRSTAVRRYRRLMREKVEESYEDVPSFSQAVKGDETFADRVLQAAGEPPVVRRGVTVDALVREVSLLEGVKPEQMRGLGRGHRASRARLMVAWAGREVGRIPMAQVAKHFGRDTSTVAKGLQRLEQSAGTDPQLRRNLDRLRRRLSHNATSQD